MDRATQPLILANNFPVVTYTIAVICLLYHLFPCSALIDDMSCHLNAPSLRVGPETEAVDAVLIVHRTITTFFFSPSVLFLLFVIFLVVIHWTAVKYSVRLWRILRFVVPDVQH